MLVHELLTAQRNAKNMSIDELVEKSGVKKGTLTKILSGATPNPSLDSTRSIALALGLSLDDLFNAAETGITQEDLELIHKYKSLDSHGRLVVNAVLDLEYKRCIAAAPETPKSPESGDPVPDADAYIQERTKPYPDEKAQ